MEQRAFCPLRLRALDSVGMVKSREDVVAAFNEYVNMNADELQGWLDDPQSAEAGTGVGVESGRRIVEILKKNPEKDPEKYDEVRVCSSWVSMEMSVVWAV